MSHHNGSMKRHQKIALLSLFFFLSSLCHCMAQETNSHPVATISLNDGMAIEMVLVTNNFYIGKYEVTQAQWTSVMKTAPFAFSGTNRPAEYVSWAECQAFITNLNTFASVKKAGFSFRLPTEEEWEYCYRCGMPSDSIPEGYDNFESYLEEHGWYKNNSGQATREVGNLKPNSWGIFDMPGNVFEFTGSYLFGGCIIKGGSWVSSPKSCISTHRFPVFPFQQYDDIGFRLAAEQKQ